ncbi:MAG TPA: GNAT family N-acetyltransferase [Candidatus Limnocylindria bacterium]|jgi:GNAT superfamily N-acetyltransferase
MSLPADLVLRDAVASDLPAIAALRERVGWSVHEWALRAVVGAGWARCVVVSDRAGSVVGVGSGATYGALGFVGNMVVAEEQRRRGVGAHVLEAVLEYLHRAGAQRVELYATAAGRPLYERFGFELMEPGAVASVPRSALTDDESIVVTAAAAETISELAAYDTPRFGGDRSELLALLAADPAHPLLVARAGARLVGFAWIRPDTGRIGPFLADDPTAASVLLADAFDRLPGTDVVTFNLPMSNERAVAWLRSMEVGLEPWDGRMGRGPDIPRRTSTIYGNAVGALG